MVVANGSPFSWTKLLSFLCLFLTFTAPAAGVKHGAFKTCAQSGFCNRNRAYADTASATPNWQSPYKLDSTTLKFHEGILTGTVLKTINDGAQQVRLPLQVTFHESGTARITIDEERRRKGDIELRHNSKARKERYNEAEKWAIVGGTTVSKLAALNPDADVGTSRVVYGPGSTFEAVIRHEPFGVEFKRDGETQIKLNDRGFMNVEHWRPKVEKTGDGEAAGEDESTWWDETFGGNTDSKPRGPESVALDIEFPGYQHVYGVAEHTGPLSLKETRGGEGKHSEPYRLFNSDVFEYEMDSPMTLYGAIPFMQAQKKDSTVGVFWLNGAETWVDVTKETTSANPLSLGTSGSTTTQTHWLSEAGLLDVFIFLGPTPQDVIGAYTELTGYTQLPQEFAIAYHQCRWNYITDEDVRDVDRKFDKHQIPYDVIWLDVEYTDGKAYFTWDALTFPNPIDMQKQLDEHDRKLVLIVDPHIKNQANYPVVEELKSKDLAVHNKDGSIYEGWCWPGSSYWVDCFNPKAREWWANLFQYTNFPSTLPNTFIWNDMNEPSVFNGPDMSMPRDNLHHDNWEHRDLHNINGLTLVNATYTGLLSRSPSEQKNPIRPFILTRSFYAGSQRLGAMWTGDNQATWPHLAASIPMLLSLGISGFPFAGADVGGFFGNPGKELLTRWYQAGAFYPFFRAHAHIDTRRREPYLVGAPHDQIIAQAIRLRYALLPAWYTAFHDASVRGAPIIRPNYYVFPGDERGFAIDDQFYLGGFGLLVKPVTAEGQEGQSIYLADDETYYDYFDFWRYDGPGTVDVASPLETLPMLLRGGHVLPRKDRPRRSSGLMKFDPYTLVVALGRDGGAQGELYVDDGESFGFEKGAFIHRRFVYSKETGALVSEDLVDAGVARGKEARAYLEGMERVTVEKVVVLGAPEDWRGKTGVEVWEEGGKDGSRVVELEWHDAVDGHAAWAVVRNPAVRIGEGWKIVF